MLIKRTKCRLTGWSVNVSFRAHLPFPEYEYGAVCTLLMKESDKNVFISDSGDSV